MNLKSNLRATPVPGREIAVVFDDHNLFASSFSAAIERIDLFKSVHFFTESQQLLKFLIEFRHFTIYLFLDYYLPEGTSLSLLNDARRLVKNIKIIIVSSISNPVEAMQLLSYKPDGFISKLSDFATLLDCTQSIFANKQYICKHITEILKEAKANTQVRFTARELELLQYFNQGFSILETATKTNVSKHTIVAHRRNMMQKMKCKSMSELLATVRKMKIIV